MCRGFGAQNLGMGIRLSANSRQWQPRALSVGVQVAIISGQGFVRSKQLEESSKGAPQLFVQAKAEMQGEAGSYLWQQGEARAAAARVSSNVSSSSGGIGLEPILKLPIIGGMLRLSGALGLHPGSLSGGKYSRRPSRLQTDPHAAGP